MWRNVAQAQRHRLASGDQVVAQGSVSVYEPRGRYQLYVDRIRPAGVGDLYLQFEQLRAKLEAEGLFAPEHKRQLPLFPRRIGVVTSPAAAALRDIINVLSRRYPLAEVVLSPTLVQGDGAPPQIVAALAALSKRDDIDVIIVARGGGSLEDLWAFNDERVARAVYGSRIPVVCGVGHETDFSLADFAADVRAPTPSAAAEVVVPDRVELRVQVSGWRAVLLSGARSEVEQRRLQLTDQQRALRYLSPQGRLVQARQRVDDLLGRAHTVSGNRLGILRQQVTGLAGRLRAISPIATLERGYAIVRRRDGTGDIVHSVSQVGLGDELGVRVSDGEFAARVA
jgi:exodeoxyribonuclease VII large subunit